MKRDEYLREIWASYPPLTQSITSVSRALKSGRTDPHWIGGTVRTLTSSHLVLSTQGDQLEIQTQRARVVISPSKATDPQGLNGPIAEILRPGDKVAVEVRRDGQCWQAERLSLLAPNLGEIDALGLTREMAERWDQFLVTIRNFFLAHGFCSVETPTLVTCPGLEPTLDPFVTSLKIGRQSQRVFLPSSPEIHLKKLLAHDWSDIFEIRRCFRNGETSETHQPEFWMLEWYRAYATIDHIIEDLSNLLTHLFQAGFSELAPLDLRTMSVRDLFRQVLSFELKPNSSREALLDLAQRQGHTALAGESWSDLFHRLWVAHIDPWLAEQSAPVVVRDWPPSQAALARLTAAGWADRAELYWRGLEIANGFTELNDPVEQQKRFISDQAERALAGREFVPIDESFLAALNAGMPPSGGIALGVERLFMACTGVKDIGQLKAFRYGG